MTLTTIYLQAIKKPTLSHIGVDSKVQKTDSKTLRSVEPILDYIEPPLADYKLRRTGFKLH
jgi:hypothetical protein